MGSPCGGEDSLCCYKMGQRDAGAREPILHLLVWAANLRWTASAKAHKDQELFNYLFCRCWNYSLHEGTPPALQSLFCSLANLPLPSHVAILL